MARKFNPKSKILGRYFKEIPYGLKELSNILFEKKPLYKQPIEIQYQFVMLLKLINKREENLKKVEDKLKETTIKEIFCLNKNDNYKQMISMINGLSEKKREDIFEIFIENKEINPFMKEFLKEKRITKELFKMDKKRRYDAYNLYKKRSKSLNIKRVYGKVGNITYSILSKDDPRSLDLDTYSDCCQGFYKTGEECMYDGVINKNSGFLVFERKNTIFAQGWVREHKGMILIDSIEFKGEFNESLIKAIKEAVNALGKHYKHIFLGLSPNRSEIQKGLKEYPLFQNVNLSILTQIEEGKSILEMFKFIINSRIYSDAESKIIKLR